MKKIKCPCCKKEVYEVMKDGIKKYVEIYLTYDICDGKKTKMAGVQNHTCKIPEKEFHKALYKK